MTTALSFIVWAFLVSYRATTPTIIECKYEVGYFLPLGNVQRCTVNKIEHNSNIKNQKFVKIRSVVGNHKGISTNDDIVGFFAEEKDFQYFPQHLDNFFKNLKAIRFYKCNVKEIHSSNLKPYPKLVHFYLVYNDITVIEEDLFDYNPDLELIGIHETKIIHIDPNVFDNLHKLNTAELLYTPCVNKNVRNSTQQIQLIIKAVKNRCSNSEFLTLSKMIKNFDIEAKTSNPEALDANLKNFEKILSKSKFSNHSTFLKKLDDLKVLKSSQSITLPSNNGSKSIEINPESSKHSNSSIFRTANEIKFSESCSNCCQIDLILASLTNLSVLNSDIKFPQEEIKNSVNYLKGSFDKLEKSFAEFSNSKNGNFDENYSVLDEKLGNLEETLINSISKNTRKLEEVQKEFEVSRYKTLVSIDAKIKLIESRVIEKVEKVLDEKLGKIFKALNMEY